MDKRKLRELRKVFGDGFKKPLLHRIGDWFDARETEIATISLVIPVAVFLFYVFQHYIQ